MFFDTKVQMAAGETYKTCTTQVTFKFVNKALLVHNRQLSFTQFEILLGNRAVRCIDLLT